ncbi:coagulation factor XIII B chain isoform X1 [Amia ocellicauda]|uniref:coagulation factor XIII B chain isoform X1 n=1 Tax=Amia ocellicauda TaxID=2972642 RepID=UPI0034647A72
MEMVKFILRLMLWIIICAAVQMEEEVTCQKPSTEDFGYPSKNIYKVGETAVLLCPRGFRTVTYEQSTTLTCTENQTVNEGWSIRPYCERIHCDIAGLFIQRTGYSRPNNKYQYDDIIQYNCLQGYKPQGRQQSTCRLSGWEPQPICSEIICDPPDIPNANISNPKNIYKFKEHLHYQCDRGFIPASSEVVCQAYGWDKVPSCRVQEGMCKKPDLRNGFWKPEKVVYDKEETVYYACIPGYKPVTGGWWGTLTCSNGAWSETPECISRGSCVTVPTIPNAIAEPKSSNIFSHEETVKYNCDSLYEFEGTDVAQCINGEWVQLPKCILKGKICGVPPRVEFAVITSPFQRHYSLNAAVLYRCEGSYTMVGNEHIYCSKGKWSNSPTCQNTNCDPPRNIPNASFLEKNVDRDFSDGEKVEYVCKDSFSFLSESSSALCVGGTWQYPTCVQQNYCVPPPKLVGGYVSPSEARYNHHDEVTYHCYKPLELRGNGTAVCNHGEWTAVPECVRKTENGASDVKCGPPPAVENGDIKETPKEIYSHGEKVTYICFRSFALTGSEVVTCSRGKWTTPPTCKKPCVITPPIDPKYNLHSPGEIIYVKHGETHYFPCRNGYYFYKNRRYLYGGTMECRNEKIDYPTCQYY